MRSFLKLLRSRTAVLLGACGLVLTQAACAHPVVVEPSVVVQARLGGPVYGSIYAPLYGASPVMMAPPPPVWVAPPRQWSCPMVSGCSRVIATATGMVGVMTAMAGVAGKVSAIEPLNWRLPALEFWV